MLLNLGPILSGIRRSTAPHGLVSLVPARSPTFPAGLHQLAANPPAVMHPEFVIRGLTFVPVMLATRTNGRDADGAIVEYDLLEFDHSSQRGVYLIKVGESVVYCGKYSQSFSKRWLYIKKGYIYHFMRDRIAKALNAGDEVVVFAATEDDLRSQIDASCKWINISGIESALIEDLRPAWNRQGA